MYDALLFDLDGTLIDTEALALETGMAAFEQGGHPVERALLEALVGRDEPTSNAMLAAALPGADLNEIRARWMADFVAATESGRLVLKPDVEAILTATEGMRRAVVTSSGRRGADRKMALIGLTPRFDLVITLDDVTRAKPAADPYLLAARRLSVDPSRCLVFEDSDTGSEAGRAAGCTVVQVPDVGQVSGRFAHHLAPDLMTGARMAGLLR